MVMYRKIPAKILIFRITTDYVLYIDVTKVYSWLFFRVISDSGVMWQNEVLQSCSLAITK